MNLSQLPANEPVLVGNAVTAILTAGVGFGLHMSVEQIAATGLGIQTVVSFIIRAGTRPVATSVSTK